MTPEGPQVLRGGAAAPTAKAAQAERRARRQVEDVCGAVRLDQDRGGWPARAMEKV